MEALLVIAAVVFIIWLASSSGGSKNTVVQKVTEARPELELTDEFKDVLRILNETNESIFITGKAGTGKSSLLRHFVNKTRKKHAILAPTGIAALNVSGQTIHSFFRFPPTIVNIEQIKPQYERAEFFKNLQMIIIDEVSMVRSDLMDGIDVSLRKNRNRLNEPFGGIQMVYIGDLFQLPPVLKPEDRAQVINKYGGLYFFNAPVFKSFSYNFKELTKIFRQSADQEQFKNLLNRVRNNSVQFDDMALLNSRHVANAGVQENGIFLTSKRDIARNINNEKLALIQSQQFEFTGSLAGKYLKFAELQEEQLDDKLPAPFKLRLKKGAQIMMLKNDSGKRWANGSIGNVTRIKSDEIWVSINSKEHKVEKETWKEVEFVLNTETKEIEAKTIASFAQYPMQLAFAMTIHKSQGKTFDKITIDIGTGAFAHGQIYVALSRCRTLEGISLNNAINDKDIIVDPRVIEFYNTRKIVPQTISTPAPQKSTRSLLLKAIADGSAIIIEYQNYSGEVSKRQLSKVKISNDHSHQGYSNEHIKAYCHMKREEREFKIDRIISIKVSN